MNGDEYVKVIVYTNDGTNQYLKNTNLLVKIQRILPEIINF